MSRAAQTAALLSAVIASQVCGCDCHTPGTFLNVSGLCACACPLCDVCDGPLNGETDVTTCLGACCSHECANLLTRDVL